MNRDDHSDSGSTGCLFLLVGAVMVLACSGGLILVLGGIYYARRQAVELQRTEMQARDQAMRDRLEEVRLAFGLESQEGNAIAIGPDGELFFNSQPVELSELKQKLDELAPPGNRSDVQIRIKPGFGAPDEMIEQVKELTKEFQSVVEPLPTTSPDIVPTPDSNKGLPNEIKPAK